MPDPWGVMSGVYASVKNVNTRLDFGLDMECRNSQKAKTPLTCVVGVKEAEQDTLSVRLYGGQELGALPADVVINKLKRAIANKGAFEVEDPAVVDVVLQE